jgi:ABC-2 type transport system permease protein
VHSFLQIAEHEARLIWRRLSSWLLLGLFALLLMVAAFLSHQRQSAERRQQAHFQELVRKQWLEQPDRHPHRVAHYGSFAFKPRSLLASFDPGVEAQVGRIQYLEAHRQNAMNFAEAGGLTAAGRLGELSPSFVAGSLLALIIAVIGHGILAEETELGRLRVLMAQGAGRKTLWWGKIAGLAVAMLPFAILVPMAQGAAILLSPAEAGSADTLFTMNGPLFRGCLLMLGMLLHGLAWVILTVLVSAMVRTRAQAAAIMLCLWLGSTLVLPRAASGLAATIHPLPTRSEFNARLGAELEKLGDSHNPDDPNYARFRDDTLKKYGAASVEELPINYKGLLMAKGEEQTSQVFQAEMGKLEEVMNKQETILAVVAWLSPLLSWQDISMRLCGTDLTSARRFAQQAEEWRYGFIQNLNALQRDHISYAQNSTQRLDKSHWHEFEDFQPVAPELREVLSCSSPAWLRLGLGCIALALVGSWVVERRLRV